MDELNMEKRIKEVFDWMDTDCIIADKVFASCQQRKCFPEVEVELPKRKFHSIKFKPGFIVPGTLKINDIPDRPNFRRVRFTLKIPYKIIDKKEKVIKEAFLPDILKDIVLYLPDARDEFKFEIVVETNSMLLSEPTFSDDKLIFPVGVFIIVKVVGKVQLLIPNLGYCDDPELCEEFSPDDICDNFDYQPFPTNFYPPQFEQINNDLD